MESGQITLREVETLVGGKERNGLRNTLQRDYRHHRFNREADLEVCTCHHLRKFLNRDKSWRVFARAYSKGLGWYPDISILDGYKRRLAIELKWTGRKISSKDRKTLNKFLETQHARKAYFIRLAKRKSDYRKLGPDKNESEKRKLKEIVISLDLSPSQLERWERERERIKEALK